MSPGALVRTHRLRAGLTQEDLAVRVGTTQAAVSRLERDALSPTVQHLQHVLAVLGLELELVATPVEPWTDPQQLAAVAPLTPGERVDLGVAASRGLAGIVGAAVRDG